MNENEQKEQDLLANELDILANFLKQSISFMTEYNDFTSKRTPSYHHPLNGFIKAWKLFADKFNQAINRYKNHQSEVLLSTIINWVMPTFAMTYNDLFVYINQSLRQAQRREELTHAECKQISDHFSLEKQFHIENVDLKSILTLPLLFIERLLQKLIAYSEQIERRIAYLQDWLQKFSGAIEQKIKQQIKILKIETKELKNSLHQFNAYLQFLNMTDSNDKQVNRDNTVLRYTIINKQYSDIPRTKKAITLAFRLKLICKWKQLEKKRVKRLKQRRMKILELIQGEKNYIAGLKQYIEQVKMPIEALGTLGQEQRRFLFSSIVEIRDFHISMYEVLVKEYENYSDSQCYGTVLRKFIPFFKLYTDYILNAEAAQKFLKELEKSSKEVSQICKKYTQNTSKVAYNELSQPTFRIARYQMLLQGIIKSTSTNHPDCELLANCLKTFNTILTQVNDEVDKIIRNNRLNQLDQQFPNEKIYESGRQYLKQFSVFVIRQSKAEPVDLIIFNDMILIVDGLTHKPLKRLTVDENFFARMEEDNKIYKNMITIHSHGFITFTAGSEDINANKAADLIKVLKKITKDSGQQAVVKVIGTEEIGSTSFAKYTEYIIEVKYLDLKKLLHMRFSRISQMVTIMQIYYKNDLNITKDEKLQKSWFNNHRAKTIEERKIIIAQIFQKMFNHELIKASPKYFLDYLNLPENFYEVARSSFQKRISLGQSVTVSGLKKSYLTKKEERQALTILCGTEIELGRDLFHDMDNSENLRYLKDNAEKIEINIFTLYEAEPIKINITQYDTVEDVCNKVSTLIGLRSNRDFRLFHQIGKKELRVLDHEQILTKIFEFPKPQEVIIVGFVDKIKSTIQKIISPKTLPTLIFKKYYYLPYQIQQHEFRKDLTRLRLMVYQIFSEICDMKYLLTFDEYLLFLAMIIYITLDGDLQKQDDIEPSIVHRVIPSTVFKLKNYSEEEWLAKCQHHLQRIRDQINKVIEYNRGQLKQNRIKADTVSKMALYFGHKHLCSQIVLNKIKTNPIFGSNIFYVQPHSSCYKQLEQQDKKVAYNMWLAVNVQSLDLLTPSSKQSILTLKYTDIQQKLDVFSEQIVIKTAYAIETSYRLNTYQSFEISQLIKYNKALNQTMEKLKQNSDLNIRVKAYRDQLIELYRNSYEVNHMKQKI